MIELSFRIRDLDEEGEDLALPLGRELLKEALDGMDADLAHSHVDARLHLYRAGDNVFIGGDLRGEVRLRCVRCLGEATLPLDLPLKLTATPGEMVEGDVEDDVDYFTHDGERLELAEVLREALILAVPMTAVCRPDCKGLCPVCGGDRNLKDCGCPVPAQGDPRLAALKDLLKG